VIDVEANLILAFACLVVAVILLGWAWCMGVFAAAPRRARQLQAAAARPVIGPSPRRNVIRGDYEVKVIER
jgi:threonine/homoserine/homoserine lactone efflux protein